jgi:putative transposase
VTCRVLGFSKQAFYAWRRNPVSRRDRDEAYLINAALDIHADDPAFGYRFIADELPGRGITAGENKAGPPVHDDLVARQFTADGPDRTWLTDITEHPTGDGKLYLCAIKDVWSNRIVGCSMDSRMTAGLAVSALRNAISLRSPAGTVIVHSDRGSQFRSAAFVRTLRSHGLTGSMGRVGACGDSAAMESFFALLQKNVLDRQRWSSREQLRLAIIPGQSRTSRDRATSRPPRRRH